MRAKTRLLAELRTIVTDMGFIWPDKVQIEAPKEKKFGDLAVNLAMLLAKQSGMPPKEIAARLAQKLKEKDPDLAEVTIAGPGFLNLRYADVFWQDTVSIILRAGDTYGRSQTGQGKKVQVEFVSANPTGPLHIGHGRGAAVGDSLVRLLRFAGYDVQAEFYINDAGKQVHLLGLSVWLRAHELRGLPVEWPEDCYRGEYLKDIAQKILVQQPGLLDTTAEEAQAVCREYAQRHIMEGIKKDLADFRVGHDVWFSEKSLVQNNAVEKAFDVLKRNGHTFEKEGAFWFSAAALGDDKDRVLRKSDGSLTYFASDIAYHADKYARGFDLVVDVWGADHHGYIPRMRAAIAAMGHNGAAFEVLLIQLVSLLENGVPIVMSKRQGQFETLADVIAEVGTDAARFMFLSRKSDSPLDFDLTLVKQRTLENPVYYVQYAYARICAVLRRAQEKNPLLVTDNSGELSRHLVHSNELELLRKADNFTDAAASAAISLAPHHISYYLMDLARDLHAYYASVQVLNANQEAVTRARLLLLQSIGQVLKNGLDILGVSAPESM